METDINTFKIPRVPDIGTGDCCLNCAYYNKCKSDGYCSHLDITVTNGQCCEDFKREISQTQKSINTRAWKENMYKIVRDTLNKSEVVLSFSKKEFLASVKTQKRMIAEKFKDYPEILYVAYADWKLVCFPIRVDYCDIKKVVIDGNSDLYINRYASTTTDALFDFIYEKCQ